MISLMEEGALAPLGVHIVLGPAPAKILNAARNIEKGSTRPIRVMCRKPLKAGRLPRRLPGPTHRSSRGWSSRLRGFGDARLTRGRVTMTALPVYPTSLKTFLRSARGQYQRRPAWSSSGGSCFSTSSQRGPYVPERTSTKVPSAVSIAGAKSGCPEASNMSRTAMRPSP